MIRENWVRSGLSINRLGLVVFEEDSVSAPTLHGLLDPTGFEKHVARITFPRSDERPDVFGEMVRQAAASILPSNPPEIIGFACTTGAIQLGDERLSAAIARPGRTILPLTPISAVTHALVALRIWRVNLISPYPQRDSRLVAEFLEHAGFVVPYVGYFDAQGADIPAIAVDSINR